MSAAFPEIIPNHKNVSPQLSDAINDNLSFVAKLSKVLLELTQKVASIHDEAASSILSAVENFKKKAGDVNKVKPNCHSETYQKFICRMFEQMENQAKILQSVSSSYNDCVVNPLQESIEKKKEVWKTCSFYVNSFQQQIRKKEDDLVKRYKDYNEAANKLTKNVEGGKNHKQQLMYHNSHNTYLLRLSSVNSMNNLLYTHVLPYVVHSIERNQAEMNDSLRHHIKYMFSVQKETLKKISKSVDKIDHAADKIDLVADLNRFIKSMKGHIKDKHPPQTQFSAPKIDQNRRMSICIDTLESDFVLNKYTQPNLHRRLAALQQQTSELVDNIASIRAGGDKELLPSKESEDPALEDLVELLSICDKEANLNVLLRQMELYTSNVTNFLGPAPSNLIGERKRTSKSPARQLNNDGQKPHEFIQSRLMKPSHCYYCQKLVTTFVKGYVCKSCKMIVHKKCSTNVPFCDGVDVKLRSNSSSDSSSVPQSPMPTYKAESAEVYDLIDLESDDDDYYDEDEFDDSDDEEVYGNIKPSTTLQSPLKPVSINKPLPQAPSASQMHQAVPVLPMRLPPTKNSSPAVTSKPSFTASAQSKPVVKKKPSLTAKPSISKKPTLAPKPSLNTPPPISLTSSCVALYDYRSSQASDLSFMSGSVIEILERTDKDWWKGRINEFEGYFPCSYVLETIPESRIVRALYSFEAQDPKELNIEEDQILVFISNEDDWVKVKSKGGEGLVPSTYVEYL